jgi:hypothetical protein
MPCRRSRGKPEQCLLLISADLELLMIGGHYQLSVFDGQAEVIKIGADFRL